MATLFFKNGETRKSIPLVSRENESHLLWEFTSRCNQTCRYCYSSRTTNTRLAREEIMGITERMAESPIDCIHITGGEPTLYPDLPAVMRRLAGKKIYLTTNLVRFDESVREVLAQHPLHSLAVSLDSTDPSCNDWLRGNTRSVLDHIDRLFEFRQKINGSFKIRLHSVVTRKNLPKIQELLLWAKEKGVDEVSCQPVSLERKHPYFHELALTAGDLHGLHTMYSLERDLFQTPYAEIHFQLLQILLQNEEVSLLHGEEECLPFVDAAGGIWNCPCKRRRLESLRPTAHGRSVRCGVNMQCLTCLKHFAVEAAADA